MAVAKFLSLFNENKKKNELFDFNQLSLEIVQLTPEKKIDKTILSYDVDEFTFLHKSKDCIIRNLCLNHCIKDFPKFSWTSLTNLTTLFQQEILNDDLVVQIIFLIHNTKADFGSKPSWMAKIFKNFSSLKISSTFNENSFLFQDLHSLFNQVVSELIIQKKIIKLIDELARKTRDYNFKNLKLKFVDSDFKLLKGFAGKDLIYVNTKPIYEFLDDKRFADFSTEQKLIVLKLDFMATVVHEASHVVLRHRLNDMNKSSPFLLDQCGKNDEVFKNISECGIECEKRIFQAAIDWTESMTAYVLNFDYCKEYLNKIYGSRYEDFDITKTKIVMIDESKLAKSACRFFLDSDLIMK